MSKQTMSILLVVIGLVVVYFVFFKNKDQKESGYSEIIDGYKRRKIRN